MIELTVECKPFSARLTERGCKQNLERALRTAARLAACESGSTIVMDEADLTILGGCGSCEKCEEKGLSHLFLNAIARDVTVLADTVLEWEEYIESQDPEVQRIKRLESKRRYNEEHKERWNRQRRELRAQAALNMTESLKLSDVA